MVRPVTAQRTKSPGLNTCTSPSRYLSLASPLKPILRSKRFIKAEWIEFYRCFFLPYTYGVSKSTTTFEESPSLSVGRLARLLRLRLELAAARIGMSPDMAIGELNVESSTWFHLRGSPQHRAGGIAHQREAACEHVVISERPEQFRLLIE